MVLEVPKDSLVSKLRLLSGRWEPGTVRVVRRLVQRGMVAVDVGAHVGYFTRILARCVGPHGRVFAFEPHPGNYEILLRNTRALSQVEAVNSAVTDDEHPRVLFASRTSSATHTLRRDHADKAAVEIEVPGTSLDSFLAARGVQRLDFAKIDVEGSELEVLSGMERLLHLSPAPHVVVELNVPAWETLPTPTALLDWLRDRGMSTYVIDERSGELHPVARVGHPRELLRGSAQEHVNVLGAPQPL